MAPPSRRRVFNLFGRRIRQAKYYAFWGIVAGVGATAVVLVITLVVGSSWCQVQRVEQKVDALSEKLEYLDGLPQADDPVRVPFEKGYAAMKACRWDEAIGYFRQALKHASGRQLVALFNLIGLCHDTPGRWDKAVASYEESARLAEEFEDREGRAIALHNLGIILQNRGQYDKARELYEQSLKLNRELGDKNGIAQTLHQLGMIHQDQGEYDKARELCEQSLTIAKELGDKSGIAITLHQLGIFHHQQGEYDKAQEMYEQSLKLKRVLGDKNGIAGTLYQLGMIHQQQGEYVKARELYEQSLKIAGELGNKSGVGITLGQMGRLAEAEKDDRTALRNYLIALSIFEQLKSPYRDLARSYLAQMQKRLGEKEFERLSAEVKREVAEELKKLLK